MGDDLTTFPGTIASRVPEIFDLDDGKIEVDFRLGVVPRGRKSAGVCCLRWL